MTENAIVPYCDLRRYRLQETLERLSYVRIRQSLTGKPAALRFLPSVRIITDRAIKPVAPTLNVLFQLISNEVGCLHRQNVLVVLVALQGQTSSVLANVITPMPGRIGFSLLNHEVRLIEAIQYHFDLAPRVFDIDIVHAHVEP